MRSETPREFAVRILSTAEQGPDYVEDRLNAAFHQTPLSSADRGLAQEIVFGVTRWRRALDFLIDRKTQGRTQKPALRAALRTGLYQLFWLDRVPGHAALHETVEAVKRLGYGPQAGFVNAVLRAFHREKEETKRLMAKLRNEQPAVALSHPDWLFRRWSDRWGAETAIKLMEWNNRPATVYARVNQLKISPEALIDRWRQENVEAKEFSAPWLDGIDMFSLQSTRPIHQLPSFVEGGFYVQDPSTVLAVQRLAPKRGETIVDLCAAPGGKCSLIAQMMGNEGSLSAQEVKPDRLRRLQENLDRLGVSCADLTRPSGILFPDLTAKVDRVLVDAPCSNTGVMRRRVELRWRLKQADIDWLRATQLGLLRDAAMQLKAGGTLVYSTCSLEPEENGEVIREFLGSRSELELESEDALTPTEHGVDGAYVAKMKMREEWRDGHLK